MAKKSSINNMIPKEVNDLTDENHLADEDDFCPHESDDIIKSARCKLCNSKYREEAEALYEKTGKPRNVWRFLTEERNEDISEPAVRSHLCNHYIKYKHNVQAKDYTKT